MMRYHICVIYQSDCTRFLPTDQVSIFPPFRLRFHLLSMYAFRNLSRKHLLWIPAIGPFVGGLELCSYSNFHLLTIFVCSYLMYLKRNVEDSITSSFSTDEYIYLPSEIARRLFFNSETENYDVLYSNLLGNKSVQSDQLLEGKRHDNSNGNLCKDSFYCFYRLSLFNRFECFQNVPKL